MACRNGLRQESAIAGVDTHRPVDEEFGTAFLNGPTEQEV